MVMMDDDVFRGRGWDHFMMGDTLCPSVIIYAAGKTKQETEGKNMKQPNWSKVPLK